ncbi:hypothetical protein LCGC14_0947160 [marine sediment metagenome]|uniref:Uncharacterized protein n=1 Tax=marine sediment metagenome TaxID=412755 RepID=A0A0F9P4H5_9ZZZZ
MLEWYAYKHVNGTLHLKRYLGDYGDVEEAINSSFVDRVYGPFEAKNQHKARRIMKERLK